MAIAMGAAVCYDIELMESAVSAVDTKEAAW